ncbi:hypothetical protein E4634_17780 [Mangrovimicrobium sediminis]|uniref:Uncharacterized protein n=1 Tax=Mangrovimicrobium sediminis TaxID=2562682 RepID=A0A4Z0LW90_9GAMM|nr:hypothetical protein [Haliea sp. SAOS-164]TGD71504.1 hypothetical protein E4634_17780 [Haliea sp. SAOS-164]
MTRKTDNDEHAPDAEGGQQGEVHCCVCGKPFEPRTPRQKVCTLECFIESKEQRELHRAYLHDKSP